MSIRRLFTRHQSFIALTLLALGAGTLFALWDRMMVYNSPLAKMQRLVEASDEFVAKTAKDPTANPVALLLAQKDQLNELEGLALLQHSLFDQTGMDFAKLYERQAAVETALTPARGGSYDRADDQLRRAANDLDGMKISGKLAFADYNARQAAVYEQLGNNQLQLGAYQAGPGKSIPQETLKGTLKRAIYYFTMSTDFSRLVNQNALQEGRALAQIAQAYLDLEESEKSSQYALRAAEIMKKLPGKGKEADTNEIVEVINVCSILNAIFRKLGNNAASDEMWSKVFSLAPKK